MDEIREKSHKEEAMKDNDVLIKMFMKLILFPNSTISRSVSYGWFDFEMIQIYARMRHDSFTGKQPIEQPSCSKKHRDMEQDTEKEQHYQIMSL